MMSFGAPACSGQPDATAEAMKQLEQLRSRATGHFQRRSGTLSLRYPCHVHALRNTSARCEISWMITRRAVTVATNSEVWIERKSCLCSDLRLIERAQ